MLHKIVRCQQPPIRPGICRMLDTNFGELLFFYDVE
jgi:hypothetical protein